MQPGSLRRVPGVRTPSGRVLPQPEHPGALLYPYVTNIGLSPPYAPMDFAAWIEVYLGGRWHTFDQRKRPSDGGVFSSRTVAMPPKRSRVLMLLG
jgi:hypothetical protein